MLLRAITCNQAKIFVFLSVYRQTMQMLIHARSLIYANRREEKTLKTWVATENEPLVSGWNFGSTGKIEYKKVVVFN